MTSHHSFETKLAAWIFATQIREPGVKLGDGYQLEHTVDLLLTMYHVTDKGSRSSRLRVAV